MLSKPGFGGAGSSPAASCGCTPAVAESLGSVSASASARSDAAGDSPMTTMCSTPAAQARAQHLGPIRLVGRIGEVTVRVDQQRKAVKAADRLRPPLCGLPEPGAQACVRHVARAAGAGPLLLDRQQRRRGDEDRGEGADDDAEQHHQGEGADDLAAEDARATRLPSAVRAGEERSAAGSR